MAHGVAGSHACGAVLGDGLERLTFANVRVTRLAIFGAGLTATLPSAGGFTWRSSSVADDSPEAPMNELQTRMRQHEGILAEELAVGRSSRDRRWPPPLRAESGPSGRRLTSRPTIERCSSRPPTGAFPRFAQASGPASSGLGTDRYSSYLRLAPPRPTPRDPGRGSSGSRSRSRLVWPRRSGPPTWSPRSLPRYAGLPWFDPRAPQNLQPVGALERHLRHSLGDSRLASRAVRESVARLTSESEDVA